MKLYGLYGVKGLVTSPARLRSLIESGLAPRKRDNGPPVAGYHAWFQARDRSDLVFDGDYVRGWKDRGPNRFFGEGQGVTAFVEGKGIRFSTEFIGGSHFSPGIIDVPNALDRIQHFFVVLGGYGNSYAGVLCHQSNQNFNILQANSPPRYFTTWAGSTTRINGVLTNEMMENDNAIVSSSTANPDANLVGGDILRIGKAQSENSRVYYGGIGEVLLYQRQLSDAERDATERWLAARWGILSKFP
ncbi:hypothetical protein [Shinella sp. DD12]|uniref:hypothetical protein n=1 Tax=Shinella sp. DD12 TaxID=1410620 RepID=UPI000437A779|nr:hypothetical protein [Shinella sp. DD12]EYR81369.1 hypothetical protein SHLA_15c000540 [Shinella sp. DD12]